MKLMTMIEPHKIKIKEDYYNKNKAKYDKDEKEMGCCKYQPVNMHGRPVGVSAEEKIQDRNKQMMF